MKILSVVGARPQFIKAAVVSPALRSAGLTEILVHTGQHYDWEMSAAFFTGLNLPQPDHELQVGSGSHGVQTGRMLEALESVILTENPAMVVVFGDTNSTLAGALAAAKLKVPVAHVEAGLRSHDLGMPEETNRVVADHLSALLFAPTDDAVANLENEGLGRGVVRTGDVMFDLASSLAAEIGKDADSIVRGHGVEPGQYALVTVHRAENTDDKKRWQNIVRGLGLLAHDLTVLWPAHPRTAALVAPLNLPNVNVIKPQPYRDMQALLMRAKVVITDSGGLQKEAAFYQRPCIILRDRTEWVELVNAGVTKLVGTDPAQIVEAALTVFWPQAGLPVGLYGNGHTSEVIAAAIIDFLHQRSAPPGYTLGTAE